MIPWSTRLALATSLSWTWTASRWLCNLEMLRIRANWNLTKLAIITMQNYTPLVKVWLLAVSWTCDYPLGDCLYSQRKVKISDKRLTGCIALLSVTGCDIRMTETSLALALGNLKMKVKHSQSILLTFATSFPCKIVSQDVQLDDFCNSKLCF